MAEPPEPADAGLMAEILEDASAASILSAPDRRVVVTLLIERCVHARLEATEEIFRRAYGDQNGRAYWSGWLTADFSDLHQFIRFVEIHNGKARDLLDITRSPILEAFSVASRARPSWLRHDSGESQDLGRTNHPQYLAHWQICRGPAVRWLLEHPEFNELLPARLADAARGDAAQEEAASVSERTTPQKLMCQEAFEALFPTGIPTRGQISDQRLADKVQKYIKQSNRTPPSEDTILRAAGRKPIKKRPKSV
ncbi:hypothetical protein SAMN04488144_101144 [Methylobacterium sp. 190mf]|uniref:hypothetical protein n=1 Tax=Methylobacterium sp. 190mf TaxID=1761798 RepID=UPI00089E6BB4|nr:hypothetical protein [Methylobacterium sp. 190mf]SEF41032.1 hypothetical protein SAMN04488144_101144 [Methylobacterium sp. 190mf]